MAFRMPVQLVLRFCGKRAARPFISFEKTLSSDFLIIYFVAFSKV